MTQFMKGVHMNFLDLVKKRQSVRTYSDTPIQEDKLKRCIEAARLSPSACNSQPWKFIVVDQPQLKDTIAHFTFNKAVAFNKFTLEAPVIVVITASKGNLNTKVGQMITGLPYYLIDIGIAAEHFCLQAAEEDLGTCMIGWFDEKKIKKELDIPKNERVALLIAVGNPSSEVIRKKIRKDIDDIMNFV